MMTGDPEETGPGNHQTGTLALGLLAGLEAPDPEAGED
jgi:hypothetical protein